VKWNTAVVEKVDTREYFRRQWVGILADVMQGANPCPQYSRKEAKE